MKLLLINDDGETILSANMARAEVNVEKEEDDWLIRRELVCPPPPPVYRLEVCGTLVHDSEHKLATFYPDNNRQDVIFNLGETN